MARRCASRAGNQRAASSYATLAPAPSASARPGSTGGDRFRPPTAGCRRRARLAVWRGIVTRRCWAWAARWAAASVVVYNGCARPLQVKLGAQAGDAAGAARHFTRDIRADRPLHLEGAHRAGNCSTTWTSRPEEPSQFVYNVADSRAAGRVDRHLRQRHGTAERRARRAGQHLGRHRLHRAARHQHQGGGGAGDQRWPTPRQSSSSACWTTGRRQAREATLHARDADSTYPRRVALWIARDRPGFAALLSRRAAGNATTTCCCCACARTAPPKSEPRRHLRTATVRAPRPRPTSLAYDGDALHRRARPADRACRDGFARYPSMAGAPTRPTNGRRQAQWAPTIAAAPNWRGAKVPSLANVIAVDIARMPPRRSGR